MYFQKLELMCIIRFKWREVPVPVVREGGGWVGGLHLYKKCGIYTIPHWHLYNSTLAFIQFHTGIYTSHVSPQFSPKTLHGTLP